MCNLDCSYCFYLDREAAPCSALPGRRMSEETLERLVKAYRLYSYPNTTFAFQGGEPTLAGPAFYEKLIKLERQHDWNGQSISNAMQTNGVLLNDRWCELFKAYNWLVAISIDGPEPVHDLYRLNKQGTGTWRQVMSGVGYLKKHDVEFNALCALSQGNVGRATEIYRFFRSMGIDYIQFIPLSEFDGLRQPMPFTITPEQYGPFMCEIVDLWWPDRRKVRIHYFDNVAEVRRVRSRVRAHCTKRATVTPSWNTTETCTRATSSFRKSGNSGSSTSIRGRRSHAGRGVSSLQPRRPSPTRNARSANTGRPAMAVAPRNAMAAAAISTISTTPA